MNERERADWLARAIDDIIKGDAPQDAAGALNDHELQALLRIAKARLKAGGVAAQASVNYEGSVWQQVILRLETPRHAPGNDPRPGAKASLLNDEETRELGEIIALRRQVSKEITALAEEHREEVWRRLEERVRGPAAELKRPMPLAPPKSRASNEPAPTAVGFYPTGDPELDSLVRVALARSAAARHPAEALQNPLLKHLKAERRRRPLEVDAEGAARRPRGAPWRKVAGLAAAAALVAAILGPLPATGLAHHPAIAAAGDLAAHVGIIETNSPPPPPPDAAVNVQAIEVTLEEARVLLGLPAAAPNDVPGFRLTSSRYFPASITALDGGVLALLYEANEGSATLTVYQEAASGSNLVAGAGSVTELDVGDVQASYVEGAWETPDGSLVWGGSDSQTLLFDREGVRTILHYSGPKIDPLVLVQTANEMVTAGAP